MTITPSQKARSGTTVLITILLLLAILPLKAEEVTRNQALEIAGKAVQKYFPSTWAHSQIKLHINRTDSPEYPFFICDVGHAGFVLVARDDNYPPILGFSYESVFPGSESGKSAAANGILEKIQVQCEVLRLQEKQIEAVRSAWESFSGFKTADESDEAFYPPLLATSWNRDSVFCRTFPAASESAWSVAIAMGQVFRYFGLPSAGSGRLCYMHWSAGEICNDLSRYHFDFSRMPASQANGQTDTLLYCMAVSGKVQPNGAKLADYAETLPLHFSYSPNMRTLQNWEYDFAGAILHQLSLKRPVLAEWGDYGFVIDGYYDPGFFHYNFGEGGMGDGFYFSDFPFVEYNTASSVITTYFNYHPESILPAPSNLKIETEGEDFKISWNIDIPDSLASSFKRFVVLKDGLLKIGETTEESLTVGPEALGCSSKFHCIADYGQFGASELSLPVVYLRDNSIADISSPELRQEINILLGYASNLQRQPFVGELDFIRDLTVDFSDQRGIEKLPELKSLVIEGEKITNLQGGEYLNQIRLLRFTNCNSLIINNFGETRSLLQLYGYNKLPLDFFDLRHNSRLGFLHFASFDELPNICMDLYGLEKYFPDLSTIYLYHNSLGAGFDECFISYESYKDVVPKIRMNANILKYTQPSSFAPCYPDPARETNSPDVARIAWRANFTNQPNVYYNVFIGERRGYLELVSDFQTDTSLQYNFEPDRDYYWRVEALHNDSVYYSGTYHFSTYQGLPIPFYEDFNQYYHLSPVNDESPFWTGFDAKLSGKAVTTNKTRLEGLYSLEVAPGSDAGLLISNPADSVYSIEFHVLNRRGELGIEVLQFNDQTDTVAVNARISLLGDSFGFLANSIKTTSFDYQPDVWNKIGILIRINTGQAFLAVNDTYIAEWPWGIQLDGATSGHSLGGVRFVNNAAGAGLTSFIDNLKIVNLNIVSSGALLSPELSVVYIPMNNELVIRGAGPGSVRAISLIDMKGRKVSTFDPLTTGGIHLDQSIKNGLYYVLLDRVNDRPITQKIVIVR